MDGALEFILWFVFFFMVFSLLFMPGGFAVLILMAFTMLIFMPFLLLPMIFFAGVESAAKDKEEK